MSKKFRIRDRLLLIAAISGDIFFEFVQPYSFQMAKLKGKLPPDYKLTNFTAAVSRMLTTGYMEKVIKNGQPYLRLTGVGKRALVRDFPIFALRDQKWDKRWRIVFYDISEKERRIRKQLEMKLKELGFGMLQESVYISPFAVVEDISEFIINHGLEDFVFVCEANQLLAGNPKVLAQKIWKLEKINEDYLKLYRKIKRGEGKDEAISEYEGILRQDPCLPKELLPDGWLGDNVHKEVKKII